MYTQDGSNKWRPRTGEYKLRCWERFKFRHLYFTQYTNGRALRGLFTRLLLLAFAHLPSSLLKMIWLLPSNSWNPFSTLRLAVDLSPLVSPQWQFLCYFLACIHQCLLLFIIAKEWIVSNSCIRRVVNWSPSVWSTLWLHLQSAVFVHGIVSISISDCSLLYILSPRCSRWYSQIVISDRVPTRYGLKLIWTLSLILIT